MDRAGEVGNSMEAGAPLQPRSQFVTALAWVFIALSSFTTLIAILQNLMFALVFRGAMREVMQKAPPHGMPVAAGFMLQHFGMFVFAFLVLSATMLTASIGLLHRREWARKVFIGLLSLGAVWQVVSIVLQFAMMPSFFTAMPSGAPDDVASGFRVMSIAIMAFSAVIGLVFGALFVWIVRRLMSDVVRAEFSFR